MNTINGQKMRMHCLAEAIRVKSIPVTSGNKNFRDKNVIEIAAELETFISAQKEVPKHDCMTDGMSFGLAIEALKKGHKVARTGWNEKGMFIFIQNETSGSVKEGTPILSELARKNQGVLVRAHINMKAADDSIVIGWLASQTDMLSDDWQIVE